MSPLLILLRYIIRVYLSIFFFSSSFFDFFYVSFDNIASFKRC